MKISDFIYQYSTNSPRGVEGLCRVRVFVADSARAVAVLTELDRNPSNSVTDAVEIIRAGLIRQGLINSNAVIIEHYEREFSSGTFDVVTMDSQTTWTSISLEKAHSITACLADEFATATADDPRLSGQIEMRRNSMNPYMDFPYPEQQKVLTRKLDIQEKMVSRQQLCAIVEAGVGERELQRIIKSDLSLLGEIYGVPPDEYICFSEFPVEDGFVDFAVFSGRSRMDVTLVEIKGADFFLVNVDTYGEFSRNVNQAAGQIRERLGCAHRNLEKFRTEMHRIRAAVESGAQLFNSFAGPRMGLQVDPHKDINIRGIVIAGRTRNDREESVKRHNFERFLAPQIRLESWDTWLRKLRRL
jgi:hypothetical protein